LILVPAGFLVLILLAAMAVDGAVAYLGQRQLSDALAAAANDASGAGLSSSGFYGQGQIALDPRHAAQAVCRSLAAQANRDLHHLELRIAVVGRGIRLDGTATVDAVFGRLVPGWSQRTVSADVSAVASSGAPGEAVAPSRSALVPLACEPLDELHDI
jgi:hypothetical protein